MRSLVTDNFITALAIGVVLALPSPANSFCFNEAGARYNIPPLLLWSISKWESGFNPSAVNYNTNGSYDYGLMQINTVHAAELKRVGISWDSLSDPCTNVMVGSWLLSKSIAEYGYNWKAIGAYHSRTPSKRDRYALQISRILADLNRQQQADARRQRQSPQMVAVQQEGASGSPLTR